MLFGTREAAIYVTDVSAPYCHQFALVSYETHF